MQNYMHPRPQQSEKMGDKVAALAGGVREKTAEEKKAAQPQIAPGAVHSADIEYAMGTLDTNEYYDWTDDDRAISKLFLTYYANFCRRAILMAKACLSGRLSPRRTSTLHQ